MSADYRRCITFPIWLFVFFSAAFPNYSALLSFCSSCTSKTYSPQLRRLLNTSTTPESSPTAAYPAYRYTSPSPVSLCFVTPSGSSSSPPASPPPLPPSPPPMRLPSSSFALSPTSPQLPPFSSISSSSRCRLFLSLQLPHLFLLSAAVGILHIFLDDMAHVGFFRDLNSKQWMRLAILPPFFLHLYLALIPRAQLIYSLYSSKLRLGHRWSFPLHSAVVLSLRSLAIYGQLGLCLANWGTLHPRIGVTEGQAAAAAIAAAPLILWLSKRFLSNHSHPSSTSSWCSSLLGCLKELLGEEYFQPDLYRDKAWAQIAHHYAHQHPSPTNTTPPSVRFRRSRLSGLMALDALALSSVVWPAALAMRSRGGGLAAGLQTAMSFLLYMFTHKYDQQRLLYPHITQESFDEALQEQQRKQGRGRAAVNFILRLF
eukprot:GHVS01104351.1.p1 GENE.GHVS01104351.1~~GHVS01104351.1.p1  ORF type:complete len:428 (+),score=80.76 GHVS01104351.1:144-1427(+)